MKTAFIAVIMTLLLTTPANAKALRMSYPSDFLWGAAMSAHQTEGLYGGGENGDWYGFEHPTHSPSPIFNSDTADVAVDFWHRYEEDLQNAKSMGLNTLRTSIAWEKVEPQKGQFNVDVINYYHTIFARMKQLGLRPMICLNHYTSPQWFDDEGGWTNAQSPQYFLDYAKFVVSHLADVTDLWITFNEPMILVQQSYLQAQTPPKKWGLRTAFEAAYNLARAHRVTAAFIHQVQPPKNNSTGGGISGVGLAYAFGLFDPADPKNKKDVQATAALMELSNWDWLNGVETGHMAFSIPVLGLPSKVISRDMPASDVPPHSGPVLDWLGVNYYQRFFIKHKEAVVPFDWIVPPGPQADNGWSIYPEGLERILQAVARHFSYSLPLIVTENGLADEKDTQRPQFIRDHLSYLDKAILGNGLPKSALDIRGYYHWSLMDNFEWLSGYKYKFGLYAIDFQNGLKRTPRGSAIVYSEEIQKRRQSLWYILRAYD